MNDLLNNAVLVYGPRKSGTTLVQSLLDGSPHVLMTPGELKFKFMYPAEIYPPQLKFASFLSSGRSVWLKKQAVVLERTDGQPKLLAIDPSQLHVGSLTPEQVNKVLDLRKYLETLAGIIGVKTPYTMRDIICHDVNCFLGALRERNDFKYWGCKEVGGDAEIVLSYFKALFPSGKMILVVRDPLFTVRSSIRFKQKKGQNLSAGDVWGQCQETFRIMDFLTSLPSSPDIVMVFYEDLIHDTEKQMRRIADFLNIPWDPILIVPTTLGVPAKVTTASVDVSKVFDSGIKDWMTGLSIRDTLVIRLYSLLRIKGRGISPGREYANFRRSRSY